MPFINLQKFTRSQHEPLLNSSSVITNVPSTYRGIRTVCSSDSTYQNRPNSDPPRNSNDGNKSSSKFNHRGTPQLKIFESIKPDEAASNHSQANNDKQIEKQFFNSELHSVCLLALFHVNFVCAICNEAIIDCICLECGHSFCSLCLYQWLTKNRVCPTCYQFVKDDFGVQRTYCVDEFISEVYTSLQELTQDYFGIIVSPDPPRPPNVKLTAPEIQASVRSVKILNPTSEIHRQQLKQLRRICVQERHPTRERNDFSLLEQQTELFAGPDSVSLTAVVQFFLSSITAYITYEGGDCIENDFILISAISVLVWYTSFLVLMRLLGYDGSFGELLSYLQFIRFVEDAPADGTDAATNDDGSDSNQPDLGLASNSSNINPREFMSTMLVSNSSEGAAVRRRILQAIAEPIRFLFHYVGVEFEDNRLDRSNWESLKEQYPWGVLPLLEHEDKKLSQSFTIGRYLGKQFKLTGAGEFESAKCDEYGDVLKDLLLECRGFFVEVNECKRREIRNHIVNVQVPKYFGRFDQDLAENGGKHLVGNSYTWIDFFAAHYVDFLSTAVESNLLEKYPHLEAFKNSVLNIPQIKAWIEQRPQTPM